MTHTQKSNSQVEADPQMTQILELVEKILKILLQIC